MASPSAAPPDPVVKPDDADAVAPTADDLTIRADLLYDECAKRPEGTTFFQRDLTSMEVASNLDELLIMVVDLSNRHLLKPLQFENEACWKVRPRDIADKYDLQTGRLVIFLTK